MSLNASSIHGFVTLSTLKLCIELFIGVPTFLHEKSAHAPVSAEA